jgi:mRNA interferase RelE/StbE
MVYDIVLAPEAVQDLRAFKGALRAEVKDAIAEHLRHEPTRTSKSRIKRLRGVSRPQYRLRVGDEIRVFYDVTERTVEVLAIVRKADAESWLKKHGETDETDRAV